MAKYRIGVIGHTGKGNYGHGMDRVWLDVPRTQIVAVADADAKGLAAGRKRAKVDKAYGDYRKMLAEQKPDIVAVCPRWLDQHRDMVVAAANTPSVKGIYMEKPMCRDLSEADAMVEACRKAKVKVAIAFQTRYSPKLNTIKQLIDDGAIGTVLEYRARGKEDRRGGGEDLWVLGTHIFNLINYFAGDPQWCFAQVRQNERDLGMIVSQSDEVARQAVLFAAAGQHGSPMLGRKREKLASVLRDRITPPILRRGTSSNVIGLMQSSI